MSGFIARRIIGGAGGFIGGKAFNSHTSSCDVINKSGQARCPRRPLKKICHIVVHESSSRLPTMDPNRQFPLRKNPSLQ